MFASLQVALIAGVYDFLQIRAQLAREDYRSQFSFVLHLYNTFLRLAAQVLVPISASFLSFSSRIVTDQSPFADYKHISQSLVVVDTSAYIILAFNAVSFVEVLALVVILSLFGQDRSLRGVTFWETNNWYGDVAKAIVCIVGQCKYVMVPAVRISLTKPAC
ncbi:MAG: hypothetical protein P4M11_04650 [Candidatus Pacebacteria bacterium]|nr:hypothetical protein [Candidatus Paceibacterota bacterium]